ncbi:MAG: caspase family protein [Acidobacteria bacterium]|nr:caspase family protein [Acidobacteriota bacterium]
MKSIARFSFIAIAISFAFSKFSTQVGGQDNQRGLSVKVGATAAEAASGRDIKRWAVIIGVSHYKFGGQAIDGTMISDLKHAASDAQQIYDFLRSPEGGGFRDESEGGNMVLLKDERATRANVTQAFEKLKQQARPEDYFIIYIAAHGANIPTRDAKLNANIQVPYFILHDFDPRKDVAQTCYPMNDFQNLVKQIQAKKGLVISDTCHSAGVLMPGRGLYVTQSANNRYLDEMRKITAGVGFIASADQSEYALEADGIGGIFTYCLLEALRGNGDTNPPNGVVTFREAYEYVRDKVSEMTAKKQNPVKNTTIFDAVEIPLSIVRYPATPCADPKQCGTLVISTPDLDGVEVSFAGSSLGQFDKRLQRTIRVPVGSHQLSFAKDGLKRELSVTVEPAKSKYVEVNLSFSEVADIAISPDPNAPYTVFMPRGQRPKKDAADYFVSGVDAFNKRNFAEAIKLLDRAIRANGEPFPDALVYRGRAEQAAKMSNRAVATFTEAVRLRPTDFEARTLLAESKLEAGLNMQEVVSELKLVIAAHPRFTFARVVYADTLLYNSALACSEDVREQLLRNAEQQLRLVLGINPNYAPAHLILANVLMYEKPKSKKAEAVTRAMDALRLFIDIGRKKAAASKILSNISLNQLIFGSGRYDDKAAQAEANFILAQALTHLVEAAELAPTECETTVNMNNLGDYLRRARNPHIAAALALARETGDPIRELQVTTLSGQNHLLMGDVTQAIAEGERALALSQKIPGWKGYPPAHLLLSRAYSSNTKYRPAYDHFLKYTQLNSCVDPADRAELETLKRAAAANRE